MHFITCSVIPLGLTTLERGDLIDLMSCALLLRPAQSCRRLSNTDYALDHSRLYAQALIGGTAPARSPFLSRGSAAQGEDDAFQVPPQVVETVGPTPRSFPLALRHAGRFELPLWESCMCDGVIMVTTLPLLM